MMILMMRRDQPGDCGQPGGHCEHPAVSADAQVLEGEALGVEATGTVTILLFSLFPSFHLIILQKNITNYTFRTSSIRSAIEPPRKMCLQLLLLLLAKPQSSVMS